MSSLGGGGSSAAPTAQQQALATEQATTNANLNLQENEQRKTILSALQGTRVFRGSALSRQIAGNTPDTTSQTGPSPGQQSPRTVGVGTSLLDIVGSGNTAGPAQAPGRAISAAR